VVSLAQFETDVLTFIEAEVNTKRRTVGLISLRDTALVVLMQDLTELCTMAQYIACDAPLRRITNPAAIIKAFQFLSSFSPLERDLG
jgi:hypothetical protein